MTNPNDSKIAKEIMSHKTFDIILRITDKLTRDEMNAIMGIIKSYRQEAEYYRKKCEGVS